MSPGSSRPSRACSCTGASSVRTSSGARRAATTTSRTSSACSQSPHSSSAGRRDVTGRGGRPASSSPRWSTRSGPTARRTRVRPPTTGSWPSSSSAGRRPRTHCSGSAPDSYRERLDLMLTFARDYTRPDGLAPQIGDSDDGRFLPLGDYGADPRDHRHLFLQAGRSPEQAAGSAAYPDGGYFVFRNGSLYAIVRCGDVGRHGRGGHGHNDQLPSSSPMHTARSSSIRARSYIPPIPSSATASGRRRSTRPSALAGRSKTSSGPMTSSR